MVIFKRRARHLHLVIIKCLFLFISYGLAIKGIIHIVIVKRVFIMIYKNLQCLCGDVYSCSPVVISTLICCPSSLSSPIAAIQKFLGIQSVPPSASITPLPLPTTPAYTSNTARLRTGSACDYKRNTGFQNVQHEQLDPTHVLYWCKTRGWILSQVRDGNASTRNQEHTQMPASMPC